MRSKLVSMLKVLFVMTLMMFFNNTYAEYYVVESSAPDTCGCGNTHYVERYVQRPHHVYHPYHRYVVRKPIHHYHYVTHRPRSTYSISVYYVTNGFPSPCPTTCSCCSCSCHHCSGGYQRSSGSIVEFSGAPTEEVREDFSEGDNNWNYYQDRATADDVDPDMQIDN